MMSKQGQGGVTLSSKSTDFAVWSQHAHKVELCLFDEEGERQIACLPMVSGADHVHRLTVPRAGANLRYGYRAHGTYDPGNGLWFDPSKLLLDPYATEIDRPFVYNRQLAHFGADTAALMPKAVIRQHLQVPKDNPQFISGSLIYEVAVKPFTVLHPQIPEHQSGTVAALANPAIIAHLKRIGVDVVELMPITAWIDERHLPPLGLTNGWGYNPVGFMTLDPRLVPGGVQELRETVAALHREGIRVILDLVFNHTGEGDRAGPTLSLRGLDNLNAFRHIKGDPGTPVNDSGTGNTIACDHPFIRQLIIDSLRHFVMHAGIDGFRFDLATILGRVPEGFSPHSETLQKIIDDPLLSDRLFVAEPWDIGPGGYQLGNFPPPFLEWNDRARDDIRRFWRGDGETLGSLATRLAGSSDIFARRGNHRTRSVNFIAAHDGFTLMDMVSYEKRHNEANGEENRDGHRDNFSWNNGIEGETDDLSVRMARRHDVIALLSTLFATRGTIMLTAGDEGGRSQFGNNNAYCQDNEITWLNWSLLDEALVNHTAVVAAIRKRFTVFSQDEFFLGTDGDIEWYKPTGEFMREDDWNLPESFALAVIMNTYDRLAQRPARIAIAFNRDNSERPFVLPEGAWIILPDARQWNGSAPPRSVTFCIED